MTTVDNSADVIDSRDLIARIEELQDDESLDTEDAAELAILLKVADQGDCSPDWVHGETMIRDDYFVDYIKELIDDCYEMPKAMNSGDWPYRHMTLDYETAADEAKSDYFDIDFDGVTYWIRG